MHALAQALADGAQRAGAEVCLRKVAELASESAIGTNPAWKYHRDATSDVELASLEDLAWAEVVLVGAPTRFGVPASQPTAFLDTTGPLWQEGRRANKVCSAFTSADTAHAAFPVILLHAKVWQAPAQPADLRDASTSSDLQDELPSPS